MMGIVGHAAPSLIPAQIQISLSNAESVVHMQAIGGCLGPDADPTIIPHGEFLQKVVIVRVLRSHGKSILSILSFADDHLQAAGKAGLVQALEQKRNTLVVLARRIE